VTTEARRPFDGLFQRARDAALILDPGGDRIVGANPAASELLGLPHEELLATPISRIHPGELPQLQDFVSGVVREGHGTSMALTCRLRTGRCVPVGMSLYAFHRDGKLHLLALVGDRSGHRQRQHVG
jgi:PAS domain S-box-containing protein